MKNNNLFVMTVMFSSGIYFGSVYDKILKFFSYKITQFTGANLIYVLWFLGACLSIISSIVGIYLFINKGKVKNFFLFTFLILYNIQFDLFGNKISWTYSGLEQPLWDKTLGYGFGITFWGIYLFCWYLIIIQREKLFKPKEPSVA